MSNVTRFDWRQNKLTLDPAVKEMPLDLKGVLTLTNLQDVSSEKSLTFTYLCLPEQLEFEVTSKTLVPPIPSVLSMSSSGEIFVTWDQHMNATFNTSDPIYIEVWLNQSSSEWIAPEKVAFTYSVEWLGSQLLVVRISFQTPEYVSQEKGSKDRLFLKFNETRNFTSLEFLGMQVPLNYTLNVSVPL